MLHTEKSNTVELEHINSEMGEIMNYLFKLLLRRKEVLFINPALIETIQWESCPHIKRCDLTCNV